MHFQGFVLHSVQIARTSKKGDRQCAYTHHVPELSNHRHTSLKTEEARVAFRKPPKCVRSAFTLLSLLKVRHYHPSPSEWLD